MKRKRFKYNRERLLLTALVAIAFLGFLLWSIGETSNEEAALLSNFIKISSPAENKTIKITSPKIGAYIKSPATILGQTINAGAILEIRIKDSAGLTLAKERITNNNNAKVTSFSARIKYKKPSRSKGTIEIFSLSPDNSEINKIKIPVNFKD